MSITKADIDRGRELLAKMTPGEWKAVKWDDGAYIEQPGRGHLPIGNLPSGEQDMGEAEGIAWLHNNAERLFAHIDTLEAKAKRLADQALVVMQLDLGYSEERPCRHGLHPIRHQLLWEDALNITPLPKVDRAIGGALFNEPITEAMERQREQAKLDAKVCEAAEAISRKHANIRPSYPCECVLCVPVNARRTAMGGGE